MEHLDQLPQRESSFASLLSSHVIDKRNVRQQFCDEATEIINASRVGTKWKPVTKRAVAIRINLVCPKGYDNFVWDFWKQCKEAKNYGACFWGASKKSL